jgi:hypothetical protein
MKAMALSQSEKQKRYRANLKLKAAAAQDQSVPFLKQRLHQYIVADAERVESVDWCQQEVGLDLGYLLDGTRPERELELTENLIASLFTVLETLTAVVSEYKIGQIDAELLATATLSKRQPTKTADRMEKLITIRNHLRKKFRAEFQEFQAKGIP